MDLDGNAFHLAVFPFPSLLLSARWAHNHARRRNLPFSFVYPAGSFAFASAGSTNQEISKRFSAISRPSRNASSKERMVASGCFSSQREAASGEAKKCVLLQLTLRKLARSGAATMDTTAEGGATASIP